MLKLFVYALIVFFAIAGLLSMKDKFMKFDFNESFEEENQNNNEAENEAEAENTGEEKGVNSSVTDDEKTATDKNSNNIDESLCNPDIVRQIKLNFTTKFTNLKNKINRDINLFQSVMEYDIQNLFMESNDINEGNIKIGVDPIVINNQEIENFQSDEEEEEEDELKETFIQETYDGITSPYCLNCREL